MSPCCRRLLSNHSLNVSLMRKVSVVILNWNGAEMLRTFLPSVVKNTNPELAEVCVADNGSTDNSVDIVSDEFPSVR